MNKLQVWLIALASVVATALAAESPAADKALRAGAFSIDITPTKLPVPISGGILPQFTSHVNNPLHARCLVLDDGQGQIAIAIVDSLLVSGEQADKAKGLACETTGIPTNRILIAATHTHSAPAVMAAHATDPDEDYAEFMVAQIAKGITQAQKNLRPARIGWAMGKDDETVFCRRYLMKSGAAATNPFGGTENDQAQMNPGHNKNEQDTTHRVRRHRRGGAIHPDKRWSADRLAIQHLDALRRSTTNFSGLLRRVLRADRREDWR